MGIETENNSLIEPDRMAKFHAVWFAAVFSANAQLNVFAGLPGSVSCHFESSSPTPS